MRYKIRISEQRLAAAVQGRLRRHSIFLHNLLVRYVVKQVMDILVEVPKQARAAALEAWLMGRDQTVNARWKRIGPALTKAYSERIMRERGLRFAEAIMIRGKSRQLVALFSDPEMAAMLDLREDAVCRRDHMAVAAIDKAIYWLRPEEIDRISDMRKKSLRTKAPHKGP